MKLRRRCGDGMEEGEGGGDHFNLMMIINEFMNWLMLLEPALMVGEEVLRRF